MICIECAAPVESLYTYYSEDNIHATKCSCCKQFADRYIECDNLLVIIDLILLRPGVIRHVVFNANIDGKYPPNLCAGKSREEEHQQAEHLQTKYGVSATVARLLILVTLFDVYVQWGIYEKSNDSRVLEFLSSRHPFAQYLLFLCYSVSQTVALHYTVRKLARILIGWKDGSSISTALMICSFFKLLPILTFIWHYDIPFVGKVVRYVVLVSMVEVLSITIDCNYIFAILLTLVPRGVCMILDKAFWLLV